MTNIDTTRKAQFEEWWSKITSAMGDEGLFKVSESNRLMARAGYLAALSTIDPEPVSNQILIMLREERDAYAEENDRLKKSINHDAIRLECAKKARNAILSFGKGDTVSSRYSPMIRKDTAAQIAERVILGTEPAREES